MFTSQVKVEFYKDDDRVAYVIFNGVGSDMYSWFDETRITKSSWIDLDSGSDPDIFEIFV